MRILWRTASPALLRDVGLVCLADAIVGASFGATALGGGLPWWVPVALSLLVFAGGSQIAAVGVVLAGGSPLAAVLAGAVLNTRLFPYGFAVADVVGPRGTGSRGGFRATGRRWLGRLLGTHLITDESVAFALRHSDPARRRAAFWACGAALFVIWNLSVLLGVALGTAVRNTGAFGLDATFPAVMLALALPTLTSRPSRIAAGTGAVIAVALTPVLPAGLPLLAALGGLGTRWGGWRGLAGRRADPVPPGGLGRDSRDRAAGSSDGGSKSGSADASGGDDGRARGESGASSERDARSGRGDGDAAAGKGGIAAGGGR